MNHDKNLVDKPMRKEDCNKKGTYSCLATFLIIGSFLVYLGVPGLPCLDVTKQVKVVLFILINILSWGMFCVGMLLGGKEVVRKIVDKFK